MRPLAQIIANTDSNNTWFTVQYLLVATVFLFLLWLASRYLIKVTSGGRRNSMIRVRDRAILSSDTSVYLVEVQGKTYVIACGKHSTTLLDTREDIQFFEDAYHQAVSSLHTRKIRDFFKKH